jgi:tetratricopeptide (TPR) repeat protein
MSAPDDQGTTPQVLPQKTESHAAPLRTIPRWRKWLYRVAAMVLFPALLFGILEASLRLGGFGEPTDFFLDGSEWERASVWIENADFSRWVFPRSLANVPKANPFVLPRVKADKTYRIFVLGESAAMGFPDPSTSFARVLEVMLRARYPAVRFEVVNTAMVAINSHVVLPIARQCAERDPDLFIVHLGNNEVVGPFGAAGVLGPYSPNRLLIRANLAAKTTRSGQLLDRCIQAIARGERSPTSWEGMAMFVGSQLRADDPRLARIYDHFRWNLHDICRAASDAGIPVVVCTIPVNLRDSAPFASLHAPDLDGGRLAGWEKLYRDGNRLEAEKKYADAIRAYLAANVTDSGYADLAFRVARCYAALGDAEQAKAQYVRARDLDALRFRSDSAINAIIRDVAAKSDPATVRLADAESAFARSSPGETPGEELFLEHVHMNFHGNYLLARTIFETLANPPPPSLARFSGDAAAPLSEAECAERLGYTEWTEWHFESKILQQLINDQPFTSQLDHVERGERWKAQLAALYNRIEAGGMPKILAAYQKAIDASGGDWMIRMNFGEMLSETGKWEEAHQQYEQALVSLRHNYVAHYRLGNIELKMHSPRSAAGHFREALRLAPGDLSASIGLAEALEAEGKQAEALALYEGQLRKNPNQPFALAAMGRCRLRAGKLDEAKALLTDAFKLEPNNVSFRVDLAVIALRQGNFDEAIAHLEAAVRLQPDDSELRDHLADARKRRDAAKGGGRR